MASCKGSVQVKQSQLGPHLSHATNSDVIEFLGSLGSKLDGVLCDASGKVFAYYANFYSGGQREASGFFGIPTAVVKEFLAPLEKGEEPQFNMLGVRCEYLSLPQLRGMGLGDELAHKIEAQENRKAVVVGQTFYSAPVNMLFKDGDVILSLNGKHIASLRDVDNATRGNKFVDAAVFREGKVVEFTAETFDSFSSVEMRRRMVQWAGAMVCELPSIIQWLHNASRCQGVWLDTSNAGSPAGRHLSRHNLIVEVDGVATPNLDTFLDVVSTKEHGQTIRIKQAHIKTGRTNVSTLTLDKQHWPTTEIRIMKDGAVKRREVDGSVPGQDSTTQADLPTDCSSPF